MILKRRTFSGIVAAILFSFVAAGEALAQSRCDITSVSTTLLTLPASGNLDVFNPGAATNTFDVVVTNNSGNGNPNCRMYFETPDGNSELTTVGGSDVITYELNRTTGNTNRNLIIPPSDPDKRPRQNFGRLNGAAVESATRTMRVTVDDNSFPPPGTYTEQVLLVTPIL